MGNYLTNKDQTVLVCSISTLSSLLDLCTILRRVHLCLRFGLVLLCMGTCGVVRGLFLPFRKLSTASLQGSPPAPALAGSAAVAAIGAVRAPRQQRSDSVQLRPSAAGRNLEPRRTPLVNGLSTTDRQQLYYEHRRLAAPPPSSSSDGKLASCPP